MSERIIVGNLEELKQGKTYIGSGLFKDVGDGIWQLEKIESDWLIKRVGTAEKIGGELKPKQKPETARQYWERLLPKEMVDAMFKKKVVGFITGDEPKAIGDFDVENDWVRIELTEDPVSGNVIAGVINSSEDDWIGKSSVVQLPGDMGYFGLSKIERVNLLGDILETEMFPYFIAYDILGIGGK